jgi:hypothetical protein
MDLYTVQLIFYSLGILFMVSLIVAVIAMIYVMFKLKEAVERGVELANETVQEVKRKTVDRVETLLAPEGRGALVRSVGMGILGFAANAIKNRITGKK